MGTYATLVATAGFLFSARNTYARLVKVVLDGIKKQRNVVIVV